MQPYYKILEINENSNIEVIKHAYRRLVKLYHPDVNKSPGAHEKFIQISEAYEVLMHQAAFAQAQHEDNENFKYEEFINEVREAANRQARMRYEKFQREHEAFRKSGLYDVGLGLKYIWRVLAPFFALGLIAIPVGVSIHEKNIQPIFYLFFFWVIGLVLLFDAFQKRKNYFRLGKFYYSFKKILEIYTRINKNAKEGCFYCSGKQANSKPYNLTLIRIKGVQLDNRGPMHHYARYDRKEYTIGMPRSQKAFIVHTFASTIKVLTILLSLLFLPFQSFVWRFIFGMGFCWLFSSPVLWFTHTRSKTGYFFSYAIIIKTLVWLGAIIFISKFDFEKFDIYTSAYIRPVIVIMLFLDAIIEQALNASKKLHLFRPLSNHYQKLSVYFEKNCRFYLEVPLWTTIYPIIRWIL